MDIGMDVLVHGMERGKVGVGGLANHGRRDVCKESN